MTASGKRIAAVLTALVVAAGGVGLVVWLVTDDEGTDAPEVDVLPLLGTEGEVPDRPALAVKIENTDNGRPQTGINQADVVYEEMVEGGLTRLLAVYHSQSPESLGPVRSARSTDVPLLAELGRPLFSWSGANPTFAEAVRAANVVDVGAEAAPAAYQRDTDRSAPYNLYASPEDLWAAGDDVDPDLRPPPPLFEYRPGGEALDAADAEGAAGFEASGGQGLSTSIRWDWDEETGTWLRTQDGTPHVDDQDTQVSAANVVIRFTPYRDTGLRDSAGAPVPEADPVGEGEVWLLTDGQVQRGRWNKPSAEAPTTYTDADGSTLQLTPGQTWIELLPPGAGEVLPAN